MLERLIGNIRDYPLDYIGHAFILLPVTIGIYRRQYLNNQLKLVAFYFSISFLEECIQLFYSLNKWSNIHLYNIYLIIDVLIIGLSYYEIFENKIHKKTIAIATLISICVSIFFYSHDTFSSASNTVFRLLCVTLVLFYFNWLLTQMKIINILLHSMFWISAGLLLYSLGTFFMYLFSQFTIGVHTKSNIFDLYWKVKQILYIIFCLFSTIGFWVSKYDKENYT
ncbi:hypothetical protein DUE52_17385 [Larkinella punicea]|uniref:Uncharacterized protein n=1 Tax=Larkinella punicea TaxID=2315727 RepID=A0A368JKK0_9BACT|nr:hypothetical protein DUE52_17385 [Larkinella punicea]